MRSGETQEWSTQALGIDDACQRLPACLKFRTAIIGLGRVGTQDDDDHQRPGAWTHAGAYQSLPEIELVAGADPDTARLRRFVERRGVTSVYRNYRDMLETEYIQLLSICAPTPLHYDMVMDGVRAGVRAIFCEKPLATSMEEALQMVEACEQAGIVLAVNHTRRWEPIYQQAKRMITQGAVGDLETIVGYYPGKVFTLGTHLFDLLRFFAGDVEWVCGDTVAYQDGEWSFNGLLRFESGARGTVLCGKDSANHVFECDLIGSRGRLRLSGDGARMAFSRLDHSARYAGYREFGPASEEHAQPIGGGHRLIAAVKDLVGCAVRGGTPAGSGRDGMAALAIAWALCESAALGSVRVDVRRR